jgi:hypothetical protein
MRFWFSKAANKDEAPAADKNGASTAQPFDADRWRDIIEHDPAVAAIAENLRPLGDKWVDEFARSYLSLTDKSQTGTVVRKVVEDWRREKAQAGA